VIVKQQHPAFFEFANHILDVKFDPRISRCIASVTEDNQIMGVVIYDRFSPWNCEVSVASTTPKFLTRPFLRAVFEYPFGMLGLRRITAVIEDGNINALQMDKRLGFVEEARLKGWYGDTDGILLRMLKEECKWL
jgi:RimJ/RimL family protein N-acetyltransferase